MLIQTADLTPGPSPYTQQFYNGLDCCLTFEVWQELQKLAIPQRTYAYERAMQGPALDMTLRGFLIDDLERRKAIAGLEAEQERLQDQLHRMAFAVWDKPLNPNSPKQMLDFFYNTMRLPEIWTSKKGERKLSMDREALEKLSLYFHARPIIATVLALRERTKLLSVLNTEIDPDRRMRTSYNIAGTETWRWSSSASSTDTGTNLQNITAALRKIFIADSGWKLCGIDLEQAESREVGWLCGTLFGDWSYLDACDSGDLHTTVCQLNWTTLPWTEDKKANRALAEEPFYRHYTRRDMAKKLGHGSNYYGQPHTMARHAKIPVPLAKEFQERYFTAFPGIPRWHTWVARQLQTQNAITNVWGFQRHFFGRSWDDTTLREAIAFSPQSATGIRLNLALYRVWRSLPVRVIAQVHDALYFLYREDADEDQIIRQALELISIPLEDEKSGRTYTVPGEAKVGWNWGNYSESNPDGLKKYKLGTPDTRERHKGLNRLL